MLDQASSYLLAWGAYVVSVLGMMAVAWRITRGWFWAFKTATRLLVVACLLTPIDVGIEKNWYAPAYLVAIYEQVLGNSEMALKAVSHIGIVLALLIAFSVLAWIIKKLFHFGGEHVQS